MITATVQATDLLNLDYLKACRVQLPQHQRTRLVLAGCGGTGSWLAPGVARVARLLRELGQEVEVHFVDPDQVEARNVYRQNFCDAEAGRSKAECLAMRYGLAWGLEITAHVCRVGEVNFGLRDALMVLVGCVDNAAARREIWQAAKYQAAWWIDCGNEKSNGQVCVGCCGPRPKDPFSIPGLCAWLPSPAEQHPELVEDSLMATLPGGEGGMSCAEMALADAQGLGINQRVAAEAADFLIRLLATKDLKRMATYVDLAGGSARSVYVTRENVLR